MSITLFLAADSKTLITASEDMTMMIHDVGSASAAVATLTGHDSWVTPPSKRIIYRPYGRQYRRDIWGFLQRG